MRVPYEPPVLIDRKYFTDEQLAQIQKESNDRYRGVEWETVTEQGKLGRVHVTRLYVDGIEVSSGLQGLVEAMENRLGT